MSESNEPDEAVEETTIFAAASLIEEGINECETPADALTAMSYGWAKLYVRTIALVAREGKLEDEEAKLVAAEFMKDMMNTVDFDSVKAAVEGLNMYEKYKSRTAKVEHCVSDLKEVIDREIERIVGTEQQTTAELDRISEITGLYKMHSDSTVH